MKRVVAAVLICVCIAGVSACGNAEEVRQKQGSPADSEAAPDHGAESETEERTADETMEQEENQSEETGQNEAGESEQTTEKAPEVEMTYEEMSEQFHEKFYSDLSDEDIEERIRQGSSYYRASGYYEEITDYWENTRGVTDISNIIDPLYFTDMKYYSAEDFQHDPAVVIHIAKNEIYARHGYIFKDENLNNYFMGCVWYQPVCGGEEFDDSVFNDYERKNLELLSRLDQ